MTKQTNYDKLSDIIKYNNVKIFFWRGEEKIYTKYENKLKSFKIKLDGEGTAKEIITDWKRLTKTKQHKYMTLLGFKTKNGRNYIFLNSKISIKISFEKSKIHKLLVNNKLVKYCTFMPNKEIEEADVDITHHAYYPK